MERLAVAVLLTLTCLVTAACPGPASAPPRAANSPAAAPAANGPPVPPQAVPADRQQLENIIRDIAAEVLRVAPGEVDAGVPLMKQKVPADEMDTVEIVMGIEEKFGVEISDEEISTPEGEMREDLSVKTLAEIVAGKKPRK